MIPKGDNHHTESITNVSVTFHSSGSAKSEIMDFRLYQSTIHSVAGSAWVRGFPAGFQPKC